MEAMQTNQFLTFRVGSEMFSSNVSKVREVLELTRITRVPRMPDYIRGVINLRGGVVPVIDLSEKMGLGKVVDGEDTSIVVAEVEIEGEVLVLGLLCDAVDQVINLQPSDIEPPPKVGEKVDSSYIYGMGKVGEEFIIILNLSRIIEDEDLGLLGD